MVYGDWLPEELRKNIEDLYNAPVYDFYSHSENTVMINERFRAQKMLVEDYFYPEFISYDKEYNMGELVGTSFYNYAMPLIRYENGDVITLSENQCSCGRESILISNIEGRIFDRIVGINGNIVHGGFFDDLILKSNTNINKWQIVQNDIDNLILYYVSKDDISMASKNYIEQYIKKQLGLNTKITYKKKNYLLPEENGKYKFVKSMLY